MDRVEVAWLGFEARSWRRTELEEEATLEVAVAEEGAEVERAFRRVA
jgi:hypothetical protein